MLYYNIYNYNIYADSTRARVCAYTHIYKLYIFLIYIYIIEDCI